MKAWVLAVLALVVGFVVGWLVFRREAPKSHVAGSKTPHVVYVYGKQADGTIDDEGDPVADPDEEYIYMDDVVFWVPLSLKKDVKIEFEKEPFQGMKKLNNGRFAPKCQGHNCVSGFPIVTGRFKYYQILHDSGPDESKNRKEKDGWIIIQ